MLKIIIWILGLLFVWILIAPYVCNPKSDKATQKRLEEEKKKADEVVRQREASPKAEPKPKSPYVYAEPLEPVQKPARKPTVSKSTNKRKAGKRYRVAGTAHHVDNIMQLSHENPDYKMTEKQMRKMKVDCVCKYTFDDPTVTLVPEPENQYDPNAIKVLFDGVLVGYIKRGSCGHIHKLIQDDRIVSISGEICGGPCKELIDTTGDPEDIELEDRTTDDFRVQIWIEEKPE